MFFVPILFCFCYVYLMFIKATKREAYDSLFTQTPQHPHHMVMVFLCVTSVVLMILNVIGSFPLETICLLIVVASHYGFKSKVLIKNKIKSKIKSFLKNMLED